MSTQVLSENETQYKLIFIQKLIFYEGKFYFSCSTQEKGVYHAMKIIFSHC
jgi:hypothetical protein